MPEKYGLSEDTQSLIRTVFSRHDAIHSVVLYGSRVLGTWRMGSDIDLAIMDRVNLQVHHRVADELDNLNIPYTIDLSLFHLVENTNLIDHINTAGVRFFERG